MNYMYIKTYKVCGKLAVQTDWFLNRISYIRCNDMIVWYIRSSNQIDLQHCTLPASMKSTLSKKKTKSIHLHVYSKKNFTIL